MKSVFLVMYLWHTWAYGTYAGLGDPALTITPMPSKAICESVGALVSNRLKQNDLPPSKASTYYWCVEAN